MAATQGHATASSADPHNYVYGPPVVVEVKVTIKALAFQEADGGYSVVVPELPGCATEGDDIEDVKAMVVEAAEGWLAAMHDRHREERTRNVTEPLPNGRKS